LPGAGWVVRGPCTGWGCRIRVVAMTASYAMTPLISS
jgi:hypothetical protein